MAIDRITELLGDEAEDLLGHRCEGIPAAQLHLPGPDFVDRVVSQTDRSPRVLTNLQRMYGHGRLGGTGYLSILPVDQGIEHTAGASFAPNPAVFDPSNIVELALQGGCNAVASTFGVLRSVSRRYAHRIPFVVKLNHNELLSHPNTFDQVPFGSVQQAFELGAAGVGATIYFGSPESRRQIQEVAVMFEEAHALGMFTILWCYLRNSDFKTSTADHHTAADMTAQANHLGVTIGADIIKQKAPTHNGGFNDPELGKYAKTHPAVTDTLAPSHEIDLTRYQLLCCHAGRSGLINSGGASGKHDMANAVRTAVINKRAGGMGLILGRKAFQKPLDQGVEILHAVQDVYLADGVTVA